MTKFETIQYRVSIFLKILIGLLVVISAVRQEIFLVVISMIVLFLSFAPTIISRSYKIRLPIEIDFIVTLLLYLHYALGEYNHFYVIFDWWDLFLHGGNSLILGLVGFILAYGLLLTSRMQAKPFFIALFSITFAVFVGVLWEIFEFSVDYFFGFSMQKSGLVDTMTDLMMDVGGASVVGILGFFYLKKKKTGIFDRIIKRFIEYKYNRD